MVRRLGFGGWGFGFRAWGSGFGLVGLIWVLSPTVGSRCYTAHRFLTCRASGLRALQDLKPSGFWAFRVDVLELRVFYILTPSWSSFQTLTVHPGQLARHVYATHSSACAGCIKQVTSLSLQMAKLRSIPNPKIKVTSCSQQGPP